VFKRSARYFVLALTLVALTATVRPAHAQPDDPCTDPSTGCIVGSTSPQPPPPPTGQVVTQNSNDPALADGDSADDSQSMDNLISYLMVLYGLA
jgi:hypothetical protein